MGWLNNIINKAKKKTEETVQGAVQQGQQVVQNAVQNVSSGYGDWLNGVEQQVTPIVQSAAQNAVQQATPMVQNAVQGAAQQGQQVMQNVLTEGNQVIQETKPALQNAAQNAVEQATPIVQNSVQNAVEKAKPVVHNAAQNAVEQATPIVQNTAQNAIQQGVQYARDAAGNLVEQATPIVQNAVQNAAQGITDKVNDINNQIQGNTTPQPPAAAVPTTPNNQVPTATPVTTPTQTTPTVQQQTPTNTPTQENSTFAVDEPILSYEDYLKKESEGLGYIKDKVTQQTDQQSADTLKHIDEALASGNKYAEDVKSTTDAALEAQKQADVAYAESQRDLMKDTSQAERDAVYKYAEETLAGALGYNQEAYGKLVEAITGQMEAGKLAASEAKNLLMIMAEEAKNTTYGAAERQRQEAERQADINRQRAIADANSAYEQNKASYGAKAEALGNMGLTAGGYGDWLNASAYAQNRSEVQGARAQSDATKREAKHTEDMTKLQADQEYNNKKYQAESDYQSKLYDIDTSYRTNMSEAEQSKLAADKAAQDAEREAKRQADSKHSENVYNADSSYADWLNKAETAEREGKLQSDIEYKGFLYETEQEAKDQKLEASQKAENAKLNAEISYVEGILGNSKELAQYKESLNAGTKEAEEKKAALYAQMLSGASNGEYGADEIASLADAFGFSQEWKNQLISSANNYAGKIENAENKAEGEQKTSIYTGMLDSVNSGAYTAEQISYLADRYGLSDDDKKSLIAAANKYASENKTQSAEDKATQTTKSFVGLLESANAGQFNAAELEQIATEFGLSDAQKDLLAKAAARYAGKVSDYEAEQSEAEAKADADYKNGIYTELLNAANAGGYTAEQVKDLAARFGLGDTEQKQLANAAQGYADKVSKAEGKAEGEFARDTYTKLLNSANVGAYNEAQIGRLADEYGLSAEQKQSLIDAAKGYADKVSDAEGEAADAEAKNEEIQQRKTYVDLLNGVYSGAYDSDLVSDLADEFGLSDSQKKSLIAAAGRYADDVAAGKTEAETEYKRGVYTELLDIANRGGYDESQIEALANEYGLSDNQKKSLISAAQSYATRAGDEKAQSEAQTKLNIYTNLLDAANMGGYTEEQIGNLATRYGLDEAQTAELKAAANAYATNNANAAKKDEAAQKNMQFINLLGSANLGELTKEEIVNVATALGLDKDQMSLLEKAADRFTSESEEEKSAQKTMNFISLLDGANTGAYNSEQIAQMAEMLGIDPKNEADKELIDMLKTAADDFAAGEAGKTAKEDMQYQNAIYSELLAAANNGDYTEAQIKELANRFGIDDPDNILGDAAKSAAEKAAAEELELKEGQSKENSLIIKGELTGDTTDEFIDDYVDAGYITEEDAEKLKEDRTAIAKTEVEDLIKNGNYDGAIKRAEELYADGTGTLDPDTYQNANFEWQKNNCSQVKTVDDIKTCEAELKNALSAGQISQADYDSLTEYMYQNVGGKLDTNSYNVRTETGIFGNSKLIITLDGTEYNLGNPLGANVDNKTSDILNKICGKKPKGKDLVMFDDTLYYYTGSKWIWLNDKQGLYEEYNKQVGYQPANKAPKHESNEKPETPGKGGTSSGGSGGPASLGGEIHTRT